MIVFRLRLRRRRRLAALLLGVPIFVACRDRRATPHVFRAPAPAVSTPRMETVRTRSQLPPGTMGPVASIEAVSDASTGRPAALHQLRASVNVLVIATRGPNRPSDERVTLVLAMRGARDTTLVFPLDVPPPSLVAHSFQLAVGAEGGLSPGRYTAQVMLLAAGDTLARSVPLWVTVLSTRP